MQLLKRAQMQPIELAAGCKSVPTNGLFPGTTIAAQGGEEVDLVIRKSGFRLAFCVGVFLVRGCSVGIYPLGADSSLETREGRCESCLNLAATAAV